jgi:hypothetical protein
MLGAYVWLSRSIPSLPLPSPPFPLATVSPVGRPGNPYGVAALDHFGMRRVDHWRKTGPFPTDGSDLTDYSYQFPSNARLSIPVSTVMVGLGL